jgi:hypothetical protein
MIDIESNYNFSNEILGLYWISVTISGNGFVLCPLRNIMYFLWLN